MDRTAHIVFAIFLKYIICGPFGPYRSGKTVPKWTIRSIFGFLPEIYGLYGSYVTFRRGGCRRFQHVFFWLKIDEQSKGHIYSFHAPKIQHLGNAKTHQIPHFYWATGLRLLSIWVLVVFGGIDAARLEKLFEEGLLKENDLDLRSITVFASLNEGLYCNTIGSQKGIEMRDFNYLSLRLQDVYCLDAWQWQIWPVFEFPSTHWFFLDLSSVCLTS